MSPSEIFSDFDTTEESGIEEQHTAAHQDAAQENNVGIDHVRHQVIKDIQEVSHEDEVALDGNSCTESLSKSAVFDTLRVRAQETQ
jgi:hypothetical protein